MRVQPSDSLWLLKSEEMSDLSQEQLPGTVGLGFTTFSFLSVGSGRGDIS